MSRILTVPFFLLSDLTVKLKDGSTRFGHKFVFGARSDQWAKIGEDVTEMGEQLSKTFILRFILEAFLSLFLLRRYLSKYGN